MKTTEKQVKKLLKMLFPDITDKWWNDNFTDIFESPNCDTLRIKVDNLPSLDALFSKVITADIDPSMVTINTMYDQLNIQINNMEVGFNLDFS